jgi:hypothetical protein
MAGTEGVNVGGREEILPWYQQIFNYQEMLRKWLTGLVSASNGKQLLQNWVGFLLSFSLVSPVVIFLLHLFFRNEIIVSPSFMIVFLTGILCRRAAREMEKRNDN